MTAVLAPLLFVLGPAAVLLVMAIVFAESGLLAGFFLPGDSILFMTGALVAGHIISLPLWLVAAATFAAAVAGDQVGYLLGRRFGPRIFARPDSRLFRQQYAERAHEFFDRHGPVAVVLARFIPVIRTFGPVVAGVAEMPRRTFSSFNLLGGALWAVGITGVGCFFGGIPLVAAHIELITMTLAGLSLVPLAVAVVRRRRAALRPAIAIDADGPLALV
jgi:membrane-associated protein/undecaprenyl-diphosphatase